MQYTTLPGREKKLNWQVNFSSTDIRDILFTSLLFILAYTPIPLGFLVYIAFIPQFYLYKRTSLTKAFSVGYIIGFIINFLTLYWIFTYNISGFLLIVIFNSIQFAIFGWSFSALLKKFGSFTLLIFPFLWTSLEYSRQFTDLAFNWLNIAHTQTYFLSLIQFADLTGCMGIVFWICILNVVLFCLWESRKKFGRSFAIGTILILLFLCPLYYGEKQLAQRIEAPGIVISYVQPNIDPWLKWEESYKGKNLEVLFTLTDSLLRKKPQLVIWPETAAPFNLRSQIKELNDLQTYIDDHDLNLVTGSLDFEYISGDKFKYNAAFFITPGKRFNGVYRKMLLVPIEEGIPFQKDYYQLTKGRISGQMLYPGEDPVVFKFLSEQFMLKYDGKMWKVQKKLAGINEVQFSVVICYESLFPNIVGKFFKKNAQFMVVITNDGWFGRSSQPYQHIQIAVLRAIENRSTIIHCANNGVSAFIDPYGRKFNTSSLFNKDFAVNTMPLKLVESFYSRYGEVLANLCVVVSFLSLILYIYQKH
jgi:apolipoprotein N-acyltransferase